MSTANRVIKNTFFLYAKIAITSVCLILSTRYVLKALGVDDYGIYNLICSTVVMLGFLNDSMTVATQRFMSYAEGAGNSEKSNVIFNSSYVIHICLALFVVVVLVLASPLVFGNYLQIPENRIIAAKAIYYFTIFATAINIMTVPYNAVLVAHENLLYFSILGSLDGVLKLASAIGLLFIASDRLIAYAILITAIGVMNFVVVSLYCHHKYKECDINFKETVDGSVIREMFSFAGWQLTYSSSSILSIQGVSLILNLFFGTIMNASQGIARQVCGQLMTLSGTLMSALNPVIVKSAGNGERKNMVSVVMTGSKLSYLLIIIIALPVLFELPFLLDKWLTVVPEYAVVFCQYELLQQIIASFTIALVTMISGVGDIKHFQLFSSLTYILRLPLIYCLLLMFGYPVIAYWVSTIAVIVLCIGRIYFAKTKCGLSVREFCMNVVLRCLLVTVIIFIMLLGVNCIMQPSWGRLVTSLVISTITLLVGSYLLVINACERQMLAKAAQAIRNRIRLVS